MQQKITTVAAVVGMALSSQALASDGPEFSFGGFIKADAMITHTDSGKLPGGSIGRDFYIPGLTPVGGDSHTYTDFHARESRFFIRADQEVDEDTSITAYLELDFLATPGGDARVTNSYSPRVRHAYLEYQTATGSWLAGQTWSNFQDVAVIPEAPDFIGATDGLVFNRQTQLRYQSQSGWSFSMEQPETTVTPYQGGTSRVSTGDAAMPDLTLRYAQQTERVHWSIGGLARQLAYQESAIDIDATQFGWGVNLTTRIDFGPHDVRLGLVHGKGIGRYLGVNIANAAVLDDQLNLDAISATGLTAAYRHQWTQRVRSNLIYSRADLDQSEQLAGLNANDGTERLALNLMVAITDQLDVGAEISHANRELLSREDGSLSRLQLSARYAF